MYMKIHENGKNRVIAVCDSELIGRILEDKNIYMDLETHKGFYVGNKVKKQDVEKALERYTSINFVGKQAVGIVISKGLVDIESIMYINDIPYIQIYKI